VGDAGSGSRIFRLRQTILLHFLKRKFARACFEKAVDQTRKLMIYSYLPANQCADSHSGLGDAGVPPVLRPPELNIFIGLSSGF